jgi:hypothetical protein
MKTDGQLGIQTAGVKLIGKAEKTWLTLISLVK